VTEPSGPRPYEFPSGHHIVRCYPVEGETFAELWFGAAVWGQVLISGVHHDQFGWARVADVRFVVSLYPPPDGAGRRWEFDLEEVQTQLSRAQEWLLENERGREPVEEDGLTAAGRAFSKISVAGREQLVGSAGLESWST